MSVVCFLRHVINTNYDRIVDLSHTSVQVQKEALSIAKAPVIFSHSSWLVGSPSSQFTLD